MRRACAGVMGLAAAVAPVTVSSPAHADPSAAFESGLEIDDNAQRVYAGASVAPVTAPALRAGLRFDARGKAHGAYAVTVQGLTRLMVGSYAPEESVAIGSVDGRWATPLRDRPVSIGVRGSAADLASLTSVDAVRAFRTYAAAGVLDVVDGDSHVSAWLGGRELIYKPDDAFSWRGPTLGLHVDTTLWSADDGERTLDLDVDAGFDDRHYDSPALRERCGPRVELQPVCLVKSSSPRTDRFHRVGADLTYSGFTVASIGYQLQVVDSTSFGQSLIRHRLAGAITRRITRGLYATATVALQLDQYPDGLIVVDDPGTMSTSTLDDENRSSVQLRIAHPVGPSWSLEARIATWRDLGQAETFERTLVYGGLTWQTAGE